MSEIQLLQNRVQAAERRSRLAMVAVMVLGAVSLLTASRPYSDVIRARGLVIVDEAGRERVVIGAPMEGVSSDAKLAKTTGISVLDSLGRLHVSVGANNPLVLPDGKSGERIATAAGLTIYDPRNGNERGGMGAFADGRANLCLDYGERIIKEAVCLSVAPRDEYAAVLLNGTPNEPQFDRVGMFVGSDGRASMKAFGGGKNNGGVMIRAGKGPASVTVYDTTGKAISDILRQE